MKHTSTGRAHNSHFLARVLWSIDQTRQSHDPNDLEASLADLEDELWTSARAEGLRDQPRAARQLRLRARRRAS